MADINLSKVQKEHVITYHNGTTRVARLFDCNGMICEFNPRSRKYGHYLNMDDIRCIWPLHKNEADKLKRARRFLKTAVKYLEKSGLWSDILHDFKVLLTVDDATLERILSKDLSWDDRFKMGKELGLKTGDVNCKLDNLAYTIEKGIKNVNYQKWDRDLKPKVLAEAIANGEEYSYAWHKGYDNSISCRFYNGRMVGHYSEEFTGCGNGHYYLLLDENHAMFCEND